ncbi:MAG: hypothetical protein ACHQ2F_08720 [Desulfobaccales bacterium]
MKKTILILAVLALLVPATALAATEFSLGGFIKLSSLWDSTQNGFQPTGVIQRNNDQLFQHGRFQMTAQETRFNFTIKGPKLWGATTTGFIEMDFDSSSDGRVSNTASYIPRLRHAMFKLNWPETELMFGQYFGMFSEYSPEVTGDSQYSFHGFVNQRVPQIRLTQKFAESWTVAGAICKPYDPDTTIDATFDGSTNPTAGQFQTASVGLPGQSSETPQLQGKLAYEQDLWGKAPFYGRPRGFVAQLTGGWQRTRYRANQSGNAAQAAFTFGQNFYGTPGIYQTSQQYLDPWMVQGTLFIPVLPTYSNNLAGSASLTAQWFLGQGVSFVGGGRDQDNSWFDFQGIRNVNGATQLCYSRQLTNQFGGYVQGQYWFTNEWFMNLTWGMIRDYGIDTSTSALLAGQAANPVGYKYATLQDQVKLWQEYSLTLWYRPIEAIKFGLQYSYERTGFLQKLDNPQVGAAGQTQGQPAAGAKDVGESHRIQFVGIMFF